MHQPTARDMVGVGMGIQAGDKVNAKLSQESQITLMALEHRVDQHTLGRGHIHQEVGEGAGLGIEQLAQKQRGPSSGAEEQRSSNHDNLKLLL